VNLQQFLRDPRSRPVLAAGGVGAVVVLALVAKRRAKTNAPSSGSWVSAVPPGNQPVVSDADALAQALAGLRGATADLTDAVHNQTTPAPAPGAGADRTAVAGMLTVGRVLTPVQLTTPYGRGYSSKDASSPTGWSFYKYPDNYSGGVATPTKISIPGPT
jgi:hypothetical protein